MSLRARLSVLSFVGAVLLFSLELMVGRMLLPRYGGGFAVWAGCLSFFQVALFGGYLYAHLLAPRLGRLHLLVVGAAGLTLPLGLPVLAGGPLSSLLGTLALGVGALSLVLSSTSVVVQARLAREGGLDPYPLYAASNLGSLVALVGYPLAESWLGLSAQRTAWMIGYGLYTLLWLGAAWRAAPSRTLTPEEAVETAPSAGRLLLWTALAMAPSMLLSAVTNVVTLDVGAAPFVWALLLGLYLGTFVLAFQGRPLRAARQFWPLVALIGVLFFVVELGFAWARLLAQAVTLFVVCLGAHAELYASRPAPRYLTRFYLAVALGGALGGSFVSLAAPRLFTGLAEYPLALGLLGVVLALWRWEALRAWLRGAPLLLRASSLVLALLVLVSVVSFWRFTEALDTRLVLRNAYGIYWVYDLPALVPGGTPIRYLRNGNTTHGMAWSREDGPPTPLGYYHQAAPIGQVYALLRPRQTAAIGLGVGAVAAYAGPTDALTFYELDPDDVRIAEEHFPFLRACRGQLRVVTGDARITLSQESPPPGGFDLLLVDAFSSDAIPAHLLTLEAIDLYLSRLAPEGLLLFHTSNRYYDLRPVLAAAAEARGLSAVLYEPKSADQLAHQESPSAALVMARDPAPLAPLLSQGWQAPSALALPAATAWTDDRANLLGALWDGLRR